MAAATKLNPAAPPFPLADAACPPQFPFVPYCFVPAPPAGHIGFCFPVQPPPSPQPGVGKGGVPAAAAAATHGRPPHKLMAAFSDLGGAGKRKDAAVKPWKEPARAAATAAAPALVPAAPRKPWVARRKEERSVAKVKAPRPRKAAGPRACKAAQAQRENSPTPTPTPFRYTTRRLRCLGPPPKPELVLGWSTTTIMLRNIPNKLRSSDMISLLDQHCKRVNKSAGAVVAAYDVLYLPMDFRRECNFGYAFINLTSPEAAHRLYRSLQRRGWTVHGSKKVIDIVRAKIQGKEELVRHLQRMKLQCADDEFLPAVFSPPRDGVTAGTTARPASVDDDAVRSGGGADPQEKLVRNSTGASEPAWVALSRCKTSAARSRWRQRQEEEEAAFDPGPRSAASRYGGSGRARLVVLVGRVRCPGRWKRGARHGRRLLPPACLCPAAAEAETETLRRKGYGRVRVRCRSLCTPRRLYPASVPRPAPARMGGHGYGHGEGRNGMARVEGWTGRAAICCRRRRLDRFRRLGRRRVFSTGNHGPRLARTGDDAIDP
ncbi:protein MEI2-like 7 [Panicum miliaceum]|uniref:Protein MEI2-like 7 n=1 Tax=Panicum miliaceum TaxID=4540 RepID=A0A3L6QDK6_PANMI|nr:protein MEI2-like 7 [Panicum miliaceum]